MVHAHRRALWVLTACVLAGALSVPTAHAIRYELQLAGMRLGQHAVDILDVYGMPDTIVSGAAGEEFPVGGAPAAEGEIGAMGMEPGAEPGMMGGEEMAGAPAEEAGMAGPGEFPAGEEAMAGEGAEGAPGAAAAVGGVQRNPFPVWGLPLWMELQDPRCVIVSPDLSSSIASDVEWLYRRDGVLIGFVLDIAGYIKGIAVAGERCDFARSALWAPHGYIKLGDSHKRVIYRYGWPEETLAYEGAGAPSVDFQVRPNEFTRDVILRYQETGNIAFTIHNMKVVRMHIWASD
jgi:hypothetical protein